MDAITTIFSLLILLCSATIHEVAHGVMAVRLGDPTPRVLGRITLNPLKHLDLVGSILLPLLLFFTSSPVLFGWAKPMPFDLRNIPDKRWGPMKIALAGPAVNILIALLFSGISYALFSFEMLGAGFATIASLVILINLSLAIFNLMPIPPLDGHYVLFAVLPQSWSHRLEALRGQSIIFMFIAVFVLWQFFSPAVIFLYRILMPI